MRLFLNVFIALVSVGFVNPPRPIPKESLNSLILISEFDRELAQARPGQWDLNKSPAYQRLRGDDPDPRRFAGINGSKFPPGHWALTFDDGPCGNSEKILAVLEDFKVKGTFFWLAQNVLQFPKVVKQAEALGHSIQNHSYSHRNLAWAPDFILGREISLSNQVMKERYQVPPRMFRCPYGAGVNNPRVRNLLAKENLVHVLWNVDSLDWLDHDPKRVAARVAQQMSKLGQGIILFHDIRPTTVEALQRLLMGVQRSSVQIRFATVPEIVDEMATP